MKKFLTPLFLALAGLVVVLASTSGQSQTSENAQRPKTKLEEFRGKVGSVIIKSFTNTGNQGGKYGGQVIVQALEMKGVSSAARVKGLVLILKEGGRLEREDSAFVDYDEIDSLLQGLDYVSKIDSTGNQLVQFEAIYQTRGDLSINVFNGIDGVIQAAISTKGRVGGVTVFVAIEQLARFRSLLTEAKAKLDDLK